MDITLTVGDRIMVFLRSVKAIESLDDGYMASEAATQEGIGMGVGITRAHAAIELKRMAAEGKVVLLKRRVNGRPIQMNTYALTHKGHQQADWMIGKFPGMSVEAIIQRPGKYRGRSRPKDVIKIIEEAAELRDKASRLEERLRLMEVHG